MVEEGRSGELVKRRGDDVNRRDRLGNRVIRASRAGQESESESDGTEGEGESSVTEMAVHREDYARSWIKIDD